MKIFDGGQILLTDSVCVYIYIYKAKCDTLMIGMLLQMSIYITGTQQKQHNKTRVSFKQYIYWMHEYWTEWTWE